MVPKKKKDTNTPKHVRRLVFGRVLKGVGILPFLLLQDRETSTVLSVDSVEHVILRNSSSNRQYYAFMMHSVCVCVCAPPLRVKTNPCKPIEYPI